MENNEIRQATLSDLEAIFSIEKNSFFLYYFSKSQLKYLIHRAKAVSFVYCKNSLIVAYAILLTPTALNQARLYSLAVHKDFRKQGIATALLQYSCEIAKLKGYKKIALEVRCDEKNTISLYERFGYVIKKRLTSYYENGLDGFKMLKILS